MNRNSKIKQLVRAALLISLGLLLPYFFHAIGSTGSIFLPMHFPIIIGGFILEPYFAVLVGILTPLLSHIFTGMPPFPFVYIMLFELLTYGLVISVLYNKFKMGIYKSLIIGMVSGRLVNILCNYVVLNLIMDKPFKFKFVFAGLFIKGIPGIVIQLAIIPVLIKSLRKSYIKRDELA